MAKEQIKKSNIYRIPRFPPSTPPVPPPSLCLPLQVTSRVDFWGRCSHNISAMSICGYWLMNNFCFPIVLRRLPSVVFTHAASKKKGHRRSGRKENQLIPCWSIHKLATLQYMKFEALPLPLPPIKKEKKKWFRCLYWLKVQHLLYMT